MELRTFTSASVIELDELENKLIRAASPCTLSVHVCVHTYATGSVCSFTYLLCNSKPVGVSLVTEEGNRKTVADDPLWRDTCTEKYLNRVQTPNNQFNVLEIVAFFPLKLDENINLAVARYQFLLIIGIKTLDMTGYHQYNHNL